MCIRDSGYTDNIATNPLYPSGSYSVEQNFRQLTDDNNVVALEYNEDFTTKLYALNYGDWGIDGVEFIYTMPRGIRPKYSDLEELKKHISAKILSGVSGANLETYQNIDPSKIEVSILQSPDQDAGYLAPNKAQDPIWKNDTDASYYQNTDDTNTQPWVLKIVVKQPLNKWFNRGSQSGYKLEVSIPSNVYLTNDNEYWYDRVLMRPYTDSGTENHYYYQILDYDHWEGATKDKMQHNQQYGMDYMWYDDYKMCIRDRSCKDHSVGLPEL